VTEELGFDGCIDHRAPDFRCPPCRNLPEGIEVYFENVGGAVFEAVFPLLILRPRQPISKARIRPLLRRPRIWRNLRSVCGIAYIGRGHRLQRRTGIALGDALRSKRRGC
jgi:hypothetical protein